MNFRSGGSNSSGSTTSGLGNTSMGSTPGKNGPGSSPAKPDSRQNDDSEESGVGHEEEEEIQQLLIELLSNIKTPKVSQLTNRGAVAQLVERPSKVPVWCNSTDVGSNHRMA